MKQFFKEEYNWQNVYFHFQKWSKNDSWGKNRNSAFKKHKHLLRLLCIHHDGTYIPAKRDGKSAAYRNCKKSKTANTLIITNSQDVPLGCNHPMVGNYNDTYYMVKAYRKMTHLISSVNIILKDSDLGFGITEFHPHTIENVIFANINQNKRNGNLYECNAILAPFLYKIRFVLKRTNTRLDTFKADMVYVLKQKIFTEKVLFTDFLGSSIT